MPAHPSETRPKHIFRAWKGPEELWRGICEFLEGLEKRRGERGVERNKRMCGWVRVGTQILFIILDGLQRREKSRNDGTSELEEVQVQRPVS
jgi:hypothetical protein